MLSFRRSYSLPPEYAHFFACQKSGTLNVVTPLPCLFHIPQFSCSDVSNSLPSHEPQPARPPCPSPAPGAYPNSCPSSRWCHPAISSSVIPFSSCPQAFPALGSFQMSQLFASCGQSIGVSASTSVLPMNTQDLSPPGWTGWISLHIPQWQLLVLLMWYPSQCPTLQVAFFSGCTVSCGRRNA